VKDQLFRRIYREVGFREGWLPPRGKPPIRFRKSEVLPFVQWYPVLKIPDRETDHYDGFSDELVELFGEGNVHEQLPVAHAAALKIDFHIGHPIEGGVGIEFKMPKNNSDVQRALGQIDQYGARYGDDLVVVFVPEYCTSADERYLLDELERKKVTVVEKRRAGE
jgi:hypothetical protein